MTAQSMWGQCRWVPWAIVAAFGVVIAVNGTLAYFAVHSDTGLVTAHPFELGNGYNRVIAQGEAQDRLGWHATAYFSGHGLEGAIVAHVADARGRPLDDATVTVRITRPLGRLPDLDLSLAVLEPGIYQAAVAFPRPGLWDLHVTTRAGGQAHQFSQRVVIQ